MSKQSKIEQIIAIASGRPYKIIPAHPDLHFTLIDKDKMIYKGEETNEVLTFLQLQEKYHDSNHPLKRAWMMASVDDCEGDELYYAKLIIASVRENAIVFTDIPTEYVKDITVKLLSDEQQSA